MEENICIFCGKKCKNKNSHRNHERMCKMNPNRNVSYIHTGKWEESVKGHKASNQFIKANELEKDPPTIWNKGKKCPQLSRKHTDEEKKKISNSMKKIYEGKSIWKTQIEKRKSYAEQYFDDCFPELERNYHVSRYFLDLANPNKKVYLEIDGEQHYNDPKVVEHDKERTLLLEEEGWRLVKRIRWSNFKSLSSEEKRDLIDSLRKELY